MRRLTRLTNAFSKKWENLWAALCLHFAHYNFCRIHGREVLPGGVSQDAMALAESNAMAEAKLNAYRSDDRVSGHIHRATIIVIYSTVFGIMVMAGVWLCHLISPTNYAFLNEPQLSKLSAVLIAAIGSPVVAGKIKKISRS
jgi:hypothetical protein